MESESIKGDEVEKERGEYTCAASARSRSFKRDYEVNGSCEEALERRERMKGL